MEGDLTISGELRLVDDAEQNSRTQDDSAEIVAVTSEQCYEDRFVDRQEQTIAIDSSSKYNVFKLQFSPVFRNVRISNISDHLVTDKLTHMTTLKSSTEGDKAFFSSEQGLRASPESVSVTQDALGTIVDEQTDMPKTGGSGEIFTDTGQNTVDQEKFDMGSSLQEPTHDRDIGSCIMQNVLFRHQTDINARVLGSTAADSFAALVQPIHSAETSHSSSVGELSEYVPSSHDTNIVSRFKTDFSVNDDRGKNQVALRLLERRKTIEIGKDDLSSLEVRHTSNLNFNFSSREQQQHHSLRSAVNIVWAKTIDTDEVSTKKRLFRTELRWNPFSSTSLGDSMGYFNSDMPFDTIVPSDSAETFMETVGSLYTSDCNDSFLEENLVYPVSLEVYLVENADDTIGRHPLDRKMLYKVSDGIANLGQGASDVEPAAQRINSLAHQDCVPIVGQTDILYPVSEDSRLRILDDIVLNCQSSSDEIYNSHVMGGNMQISEPSFSFAVVRQTVKQEPKDIRGVQFGGNTNRLHAMKDLRHLQLPDRSIAQTIIAANASRNNTGDYLDTTYASNWNQTKWSQEVLRLTRPEENATVTASNVKQLADLNLDDRSNLLLPQSSSHASSHYFLDGNSVKTDELLDIYKHVNVSNNAVCSIDSVKSVPADTITTDQCITTESSLSDSIYGDQGNINTNTDYEMTFMVHEKSSFGIDKAAGVDNRAIYLNATEKPSADMNASGVECKNYSSHTMTCHTNVIAAKYTVNRKSACDETVMKCVERTEHLLQTPGSTTYQRRVHNSGEISATVPCNGSTDIQRINEPKAEMNLQLSNDDPLEKTEATDSFDDSNDGFILVTSSRRTKLQKKKFQPKDVTDTPTDSNGDKRTIDSHNSNSRHHVLSCQIAEPASSNYLLASFDNKKSATITLCFNSAHNSQNETEMEKLSSMSVVNPSEPVHTNRHDAHACNIDIACTSIECAINGKALLEKASCMHEVQCSDNNTELSTTDPTAAEMMSGPETITESFVFRGERKNSYERDTNGETVSKKDLFKTVSEDCSSEKCVIRMMEGTDVYSQEYGEAFLHSDECGGVLLNLYTGGRRRILKPHSKFTKPDRQITSRSGDNESDYMTPDTKSEEEQKNALQCTVDIGDLNSSAAETLLNRSITKAGRRRGKGNKRKREGIGNVETSMHNSEISELNVSDDSGSIDASLECLEDIGNDFYVCMSDDDTEVNSHKYTPIFDQPDEADEMNQHLDSHVGEIKCTSADVKDTGLSHNLRINTVAGLDTQDGLVYKESNSETRTWKPSVPINEINDKKLNCVPYSAEREQKVIQAHNKNKDIENLQIKFSSKEKIINLSDFILENCVNNSSDNNVIITENVRWRIGDAMWESVKKQERIDYSKDEIQVTVENTTDFLGDINENIGGDQWRSNGKESSYREYLANKAKSCRKTLAYDRDGVFLGNKGWESEDIGNRKWACDHDEDEVCRENKTDTLQCANDYSVVIKGKDIKIYNIGWKLEDISDVNWESDEEEEERKWNIAERMQERNNDNEGNTVVQMKIYNNQSRVAGIEKERQKDDLTEIMENPEDMTVATAELKFVDIDNVKWESDNEEQHSREMTDIAKVSRNMSFGRKEDDLIEDGVYYRVTDTNSVKIVSDERQEQDLDDRRREINDSSAVLRNNESTIDDMNWKSKNEEDAVKNGIFNRIQENIYIGGHSKIDNIATDNVESKVEERCDMKWELGNEKQNGVEDVTVVIIANNGMHTIDRHEYFCEDRLARGGQDIGSVKCEIREKKNEGQGSDVAEKNQDDRAEDKVTDTVECRVESIGGVRWDRVEEEDRRQEHIDRDIVQEASDECEIHKIGEIKLDNHLIVEDIGDTKWQIDDNKRDGKNNLKYRIQENTEGHVVCKVENKGDGRCQIDGKNEDERNYFGYRIRESNEEYVVSRGEDFRGENWQIGDKNERSDLRYTKQESNEEYVVNIVEGIRTDHVQRNANVKLERDYGDKEPNARVIDRSKENRKTSPISRGVDHNGDNEEWHVEDTGDLKWDVNNQEDDSHIKNQTDNILLRRNVSKVSQNYISETNNMEWRPEDVDYVKMNGNVQNIHQIDGVLDRIQENVCGLENSLPDNVQWRIQHFIDVKSDSDDNVEEPIRKLDDKVIEIRNSRAPERIQDFIEDHVECRVADEQLSRDTYEGRLCEVFGGSQERNKKGVVNNICDIHVDSIQRPFDSINNDKCKSGGENEEQRKDLEGSQSNKVSNAVCIKKISMSDRVRWRVQDDDNMKYESDDEDQRDCLAYTIQETEHASLAYATGERQGKINQWRVEAANDLKWESDEENVKNGNDRPDRTQEIIEFDAVGRTEHCVGDNVLRKNDYIGDMNWESAGECEQLKDNLTDRSFLCCVDKIRYVVVENTTSKVIDNIKLQHKLDENDITNDPENYTHENEFELANDTDKGVTGFYLKLKTDDIDSENPVGRSCGNRELNYQNAVASDLQSHNGHSVQQRDIARPVSSTKQTDNVRNKQIHASVTQSADNPITTRQTVAVGFTEIIINTSESTSYHDYINPLMEKFTCNRSVNHHISVNVDSSLESSGTSHLPDDTVNTGENVAIMNAPVNVKGASLPKDKKVKTTLSKSKQKPKKIKRKKNMKYLKKNVQARALEQANVKEPLGAKSAASEVKGVAASSQQFIAALMTQL